MKLAVHEEKQFDERVQLVNSNDDTIAYYLRAQKVSAKVKEETDRLDQAIRTTMDRVDDTADRVRSNVRAKTSWIIGAIRGLRVAVESALHTNSHAQASDRVM